MFKELLAKLQTVLHPQQTPLLSPVSSDRLIPTYPNKEAELTQKFWDGADYLDAVSSETQAQPKLNEIQARKEIAAGKWIPQQPIQLNGTSSTNTARPVATPTVSKIDPKIQSFLETRVFPTTRPMNIPDSVAAGQLAAEGGLGNGLGAKRNNFYNINAIDSNPNAANKYASPEEGVRSYAQLLSKKYKQALQYGNPDQVISGIEQGGYAGDPKTYAARAKNGYTSYAEFVKNTPAYKYYANKH